LVKRRRSKVWTVSLRAGRQSGKNAVAAIFSVLLLFCCAANTVAQEDQLLWSRTAPYHLCESDVLSLRFPLTPEFNQTARVGPDGFVGLEEVGEVSVEGLTIDEASEAIQSAYAGILRAPVISIELQQFNGPYFIASGEVNNPGKYDLRGYTSVTDAVAIAGGFRESAKLSKVLLFRRTGDEWNQVKAINVKQILKGRSLGADSEVRTGDMLVVSRSALSKMKKFVP
jgi:protein involved in polysaccharide export with SLBB domain